ncbi:hypothetical protein EVAR_45622_1 [Eumeta japonica]|uniref:Uncharacterized protein n=1 Tax=Eumeta variegata TaxID=151549 RepID=A0A4C1WDW2_EUMVA|nr:hypothetical protein EVAR_45622_1 [Eumeta japonica]
MRHLLSPRPFPTAHPQRNSHTRGCAMINAVDLKRCESTQSHCVLSQLTCSPTLDVSTPQPDRQQMCL